MRRLATAFAPCLASCLALAGCDSSVDRQRAATCRRALPALVQDGSAVRVIRIGEAREGEGVRIDYAAGPPSGRQRWAVCRFGPGAELVGLTTERGPLGGAALYFLTHYYLDTPDAAAADPVAAGR